MHLIVPYTLARIPRELKEVKRDRPRAGEDHPKTRKDRDTYVQVSSHPNTIQTYVGLSQHPFPTWHDETARVWASF